MLEKKFGELPLEEQLKLVKGQLRGQELEHYIPGVGWRDKESTGWLVAFWPGTAYRFKVRPLQVPWASVSPEYKWAAKDRSGVVFAHKAEPRLHLDTGYWCSPDELRLPSWLFGLVPGTVPWDKSLVERPA